jgi:hypothetical protein
MRTPDEHGMGAFANVLEAPLRTHRIGSSESWWYAVGALPGGAIDMLVVDGPPWTTGPLARYPAGPLLFRRLAPGAVVIVDDAARADEGAVLERWREYPDLSQEKVECEKGCTLLRRASGKPRPTP